jgi:type IV pilus assembly protein PilE
MRFTKNQGFTLVELMIVIAVIGILARIALPSYTSYIARGKVVEGGINLAAYRTSMEQYYQDMRSYAASGATTTCGVPISSVTSKYFSYLCTVSGTGAAQTFTATASSVVGQGLGTTAGGYVYTIDDNNTKMTTMFAGVAVTAASGTGCWILKKGQSC